MSIKAMMHVWWSSKSSGNDRLTLLAIADEADDEGRNAFPSVRRLAEKVNCHTDTITACIKRLEELAELEVVRPEKQGRGRFNRYKIIMPQSPENITPLTQGSIYGSVEGLVRTHSAQNKDQSGPKQATVRVKDFSGQRFQPPRKGCEACAGGWREDERGNAFACGCEEGIYGGINS